VEKYCTNLKGSVSDNESLAIKLQDNDKELYKANMFKREVEMQLQSRNDELEDAKRRFNDDNDEKNSRINQLHQEVKNLQDKLNDNNIKCAMVEGKNHDISGNYERTVSQTTDNINRLKIEYERLTGENSELLAKISRTSNELENNRIKLDKQKYEDNFELQKVQQDIEEYQNRIRNASSFYSDKDNSLKGVCKVKYEDEVRSKDTKAELDHQISDLKFHITKCAGEGEELKRKIDHTSKLYEEAYSDNEKILRDFDEYKRHQQQVNLQKDNEINSLKSETFYAENKIKEASEKIRNLDLRLFDGDNLFNDTKNRLSNDINSVIERQTNLKMK